MILKKHNFTRSRAYWLWVIFSLDMRLTAEQYDALVKKLSPRSKTGADVLKAFAVGGLICTLGQLLLQWYEACMDEELAAAAVSVTLIALSALLTGLGWYDDLARFAGAGTLVPITGFANAVVAPALEFKSEGLIPGTAVKLFTVSGPVIVWGVSAGIVYGIILWLMQVL